MGSWGPGPFDDDKALDWLFDLSRSGDLERLLESTLRSAMDSDDLLHTQAVQALACAEVMLALAGSPMTDLPEVIDELLAEHRFDLDLCGLLKLSRSTTQAILEGSELRTTREESLGLTEWTIVVEDLIRRLDAGIKKACPSA
jgi:hypothetical protein